MQEPSICTDLVTISNTRSLQHSLDTLCNRNVQTTTVCQLSESCEWDSPLFSFGLSEITTSHSFPSWITTLRLSLRGDLGLLGLRTLWKYDCTFPIDSWKTTFLLSILMKTERITCSFKKTIHAEPHHLLSKVNDNTFLLMSFF